MSFASWHDFYYGTWQQPWALLVAPFGFLVWRTVAAPAGRGAVPAAQPFVVAWSWIFVAETMLDPIATGPLAAALGGDSGTTLGLLFVLAGDFRIWWLAFGLEAARRGAAPALLATAAVPVFAWLGLRALGLACSPSPPGQVLWLVHESAFVALAAFVARRRAHPFVRDVLAYAAVYYALWAACDALILAGVDEAWLLRCVPNQLYYGLTVPFVWWRFFSASYASSSASTQASR